MPIMIYLSQLSHSETEERAQTSEDRAFTAESALKEANERIRALEKQLSDVTTAQNASPGSPPENGE